MEWAFKSLPLSGKESVPMEVDPWSEIYTVRESVWKQSGMKPMGGCLCVGCLEKRLGRQLTPEDFESEDAFNRMPGSVRLMSRRMGSGLLDHADGLFAVCGSNATRVKSVGEGEEIIRKWAEGHAN
jgi:hypothetical protein